MEEVEASEEEEAIVTITEEDKEATAEPVSSATKKVTFQRIAQIKLKEDEEEVVLEHASSASKRDTFRETALISLPMTEEVVEGAEAEVEGEALAISAMKRVTSLGSAQMLQVLVGATKGREEMTEVLLGERTMMMRAT